MSVTAIIVTYNSVEVIESALSCVYAHPEVTACIVVDNASTDSTIDTICQKFPKVRVIANQENLGFGTACNQALERMTTEFALLLNPDSTIDSEGINTLLKSFTLYPNAAIIAPVLSEQSFRQPLLYDRASVNPVPLPGSNVFPVSFVSGAMAMWKMNLMKQVGFFDPAFFLFFEDDDISIRVLQAGYDLLLLSGINAKHTPGHSCTLTEEIESLKLRSSVWSYLYIHGKYRGEKHARNMARSMIVRTRWKKLVYQLLTGKQWTEENTKRRQENIIEAREKALAVLAKKWATVERKHNARREDAMKAHEKRWAETMAEQENILAASIEEHNESRVAADDGLKAEREEIVQQFEIQQESRIRAFETYWEKVTDKHDQEFADALSRVEAVRGTVYTKLETEWTNAVQQHELLHKNKETEHEERWMEKMQDQGEELAAAAQKHEAEWAVIAGELETQWLAMANDHEQRRKSSMQGYEGEWIELTKQYESKRKELTAQRETEWKVITREYETSWIDMAKEHEKKRENVMRGYQEKWDELHATHEETLADMAAQRDAEWVSRAKGFEIQWTELSKKQEAAQAAVIANHDAKWLAITQKQERQWLAAQQQKENDNKLWAALYFLRSPGKFRQ